MVKISFKPKRRPPPDTSADHANRESYLLQAVDLLRESFRAAGHEIPPVRVSVGWPGGQRGGKHVIGQCWPRQASRDHAFQIFISPTIEDSIEALSTLTHELCHACTDCHGHSPEFGALARAIGLDGKLTATYPGRKLTDWLNAIVEKLGKYPHAALIPGQSGTKKDGTRQIKCYCPASGYIARTSRQWLAAYGPPLSPATKKPMLVCGPKEKNPR